jgi:hypothetical protein
MKSADLTKDDFVICLPCPLGTEPAMPDNVFGVCALCECRIQYRPHVPDAPTKLCKDCALDNMTVGQKVALTEETVAEIRRMQN